VGSHRQEVTGTCRKLEGATEEERRVSLLVRGQKEVLMSGREWGGKRHREGGKGGTYIKINKIY
jgi:hypothetical protein